MSEIFEALLRALFELIFEILVKGPGWLIVRLCPFEKPPNPDGCLVISIGLAWWTVVGLLIWGAIAFWPF